MVTKEQAMSTRHGDVFHFTGLNGECPCRMTVGPRGGKTEKITRVRVTGRCVTWKTRPGEFRLPVKWGLRGYAYIEAHNAYAFHREEDCPLGRMESEEPKEG